MSSAHFTLLYYSLYLMQRSAPFSKASRPVGWYRIPDFTGPESRVRMLEFYFSRNYLRVNVGICFHQAPSSPWQTLEVFIFVAFDFGSATVACSRGSAKGDVSSSNEKQLRNLRCSSLILRLEHSCDIRWTDPLLSWRSSEIMVSRLETGLKDA